MNHIGGKVLLFPSEIFAFACARKCMIQADTSAGRYGKGSNPTACTSPTALENRKQAEYVSIRSLLTRPTKPTITGGLLCVWAG